MTTTTTTGPPPTGSGPAPSLTEREYDVLRRYATGSTYRQIARQISFTTASVGNVATRIMRKLGAHTMAHAVYLACQHGILTVDAPGARVDERRTQQAQRLIHSLIAAGWTITSIADCMCFKQAELSQIMRRHQITARTVQAMERAFAELYPLDPEAVGVSALGVTRSRNHAVSMGWTVIPAEEARRIRAAFVDAA